MGLAGVAIDSVEDMKVSVCDRILLYVYVGNYARTFQSFSVEQCNGIFVIQVCTCPICIVVTLYTMLMLCFIFRPCLMEFH